MATSIFKILGIILIVAFFIFIGRYVAQDLAGKATAALAPNPPCARGDLTGEGALDADDLDRWLSLMETPEQVTCCVDLDSDGFLTQTDYDLFFDAFLEGKSLGTCEG